MMVMCCAPPTLSAIRSWNVSIAMSRRIRGQGTDSENQNAGMALNVLGNVHDAWQCPGHHARHGITH
jgi:hypothetical protein